MSLEPIPSFKTREAFWNARTPEMLLEAGSDSRRVLEACDEEIALVKDFVLGHFRKHELREMYWKPLGLSMVPKQFYGPETAIAEIFIRDLCEYRNASLPVSSIPSELLSCIFGHLLPVIGPRHYRSTDDDMSERHDKTRNQIADATRDLISATHVCRRWRNVALANPTLWTFLWLDNRSWLKRMVERSKNAPLIIMQTLDRYLSHDYIRDLLPCLFRRLQPRRLSLQLDLGFRALDNLISIPTMLLRPAPSLEILEIDAMHGEGHLKDVTALTRHLCLPPTASIAYVIGLHGDTLDDTLLSRLSALILPTTDGPPVETVDIAFARNTEPTPVHEMSFTMQLWHNQDDGTVTMDESGRSKPSFSATFIITAPRQRPEDAPAPSVVESVTDDLVYVLDTVLSLLPLDSVEELRCTAIPNMSQEAGAVLSLNMCACATILPHFSTSVVTLVLENGVHGFNGLFDALASDRTLLRRLITIQLVEWEFAVLLHSYTDRQRHAWGVLSLFQANKLADVLRDVASDRGVKLLELCKCNITEFIGEEFEGIADKLVLTECFANFD
ncbi:uncharacterized protein STEHIDRAFT_161671 [Stereum hirsutum FP-91666 SS1]|uniref:uncharacterized protein n=1 Tax=Stereum hirsutum (strain FP-91666) TaxID=721885 RepID=UPI0004449643|nr:uncharacterized protein STEHIDRAFT_161671 [Stereum hirsutum FP-91666 SS1]EIM81485.1 hypothetical protein STEHIDRAFT_161671 [Stereum hirsutum FP-91666 SS1]